MDHMARTCGEASSGISSLRLSLATPRMVCAKVRESFLFHAKLTVRCLSCDVQADELRSCRGAEAQCSDFKWRYANASSDFLGLHGWPKYQCSESHTVSGTAGTPELFAVKSEDVLQAVSQCRPVEYGETSRSPYATTENLGNHVPTHEEKVQFPNGLPRRIESEREEFSTS